MSEETQSKEPGAAERDAVFQNPQSIEEAIESIEGLRGALLFGDFNEVLQLEDHPKAEQYVLLALSSLHHAIAYLRLASLEIPVESTESEVGEESSS